MPMGIKDDCSLGLPSVAKGFDTFRVRGTERRNKNDTNEIGAQKGAQKGVKGKGRERKSERGRAGE